MEKLNRILEFKKQFSSIELSLKLKALGVSQDTCFMWVLNKQEHPCAGWSIFANSLVSQKLSWEDKCSAYSCAELGEMLPVSIIVDNNYFRVEFSKSKGGYQRDHGNHGTRFSYDVIKEISGFNYDARYCNEDSVLLQEFSPIEANARAKMLIYLIENKLLDI